MKQRPFRTKTNLSYLPEGKRAELAFVLENVRDGFAEVMKRRRSPRYVGGRILKVVLFGSYARGDWTDDPIGRYFSDYDILVVVDREELTKLDIFWGGVDKRLRKELSSGDRLRTQPNLIVHDLADVNRQLREGRYFFVDILNDGVLLFEEPDYPFETPEALKPADALVQAQAYFEDWFQSGLAFQRGGGFYVSDARPKEAAFSYHQAAEKLYHGLLLVLTLYSPKTHRLNRLRDFVEEIDRRFRDVWPKSTKFERQAFDRLRRAYVDARYSARYEISAEQLSWIDARVTALSVLVREVCEDRISALKSEAAKSTS